MGSGKAARRRADAGVREWDSLVVPNLVYEKQIEDPYSTGLQRNVASRLDQISQTGYDDIDRARMAQLAQDEARSANANRQAALESLNRRGVAGSSLDIANTLQGNQAARNQAANRALQITADGATRRLQATGMLGDEAARIRAANDEINRFNLVNKQNVQQQNFQNRMSKVGGKAAALGGASQVAANTGWGAAAPALLGSAITAGGAALASDEEGKTAIRDGSSEIEEVFEKVEPSSFEYKDKPGRFASVMAQDLERSKLGKDLVMEDEAGRKYIDSPQATGLLLAAQKVIMDRLAKLEKKES